MRGGAGAFGRAVAVGRVRGVVVTLTIGEGGSLVAGGGGAGSADAIVAALDSVAAGIGGAGGNIAGALGGGGAIAVVEGVPQRAAMTSRFR